MKFLGRVSLLRAPALSPSTKSLRILRWHAQVGDLLPAYSLLCDVSTSSLINQPQTKISSSSSVNFKEDEYTELNIELQEEVIVARRYVEVDEIVPVGTPLALLCEDASDVSACATISADEADALTKRKQPQVLEALWQAYLAKPPVERGCS
jgi:pyruvate/2-oxoglutarate dehydrogenase complex dihydrolipoamide acyltransferase (E2) component